MSHMWMDKNDPNLSKRERGHITATILFNITTMASEAEQVIVRKLIPAGTRNGGKKFLKIIGTMGILVHDFGQSHGR